MSYTNKGRLQSIDALRGFAALAVMLVHACQLGIFNRQPYQEVDRLTALINHILLLPVSYGFAGVYLFFVISGFCIHLRWAKKQSTGDIGVIEFIPFWKRRIRRLYPAYLAAMVCYLLLNYFAYNNEFDSFYIWNVFSHLLMIHNFDTRTVYLIDSAFWTLAIEEQLYLLYFLLLRLRTKLGWKRTIIICFLARIGWFGFALIIYKLFQLKVPVSESAISNWVIWALGAISIEAALGLIKLPKYCYSLNLMTCVFVMTATTYWLDWFLHIGDAFHIFTIIFGQIMWGLFSFILVNRIVSLEWSAIFSKREENRFYQKIFALLASLGIFSYSLYLTHEFVFFFIPDFYWLIKAVVSITFAWLFFLLFEKPFLSEPSKLTNSAVLDKTSVLVKSPKDA